MRLMVLKAARALTPPPEVIVITAYGTPATAVQAMRQGAYDYIAKPFKTQELLARVKTRLRRASSREDDPSTLRIGDVSIDVEAHTVHRGDVPIALTPLEFDLLLALARKPRQAFTRELLLQEVWGYRHPGDTRLVNVHVQRLRGEAERLQGQRLATRAREEALRLISTASMKDGRINPAAMEEYIRENGALFNREPFISVRDDLFEAIKSENGLRRLEDFGLMGGKQTKSFTIAEAEKTIASIGPAVAGNQIVGTSHDHEPVRAVGQWRVNVGSGISRKLV